MSEQLVGQVRELLNQNDEESLRYILCDEQQNVVQAICSQLTEPQKKIVSALYKASRNQQEPEFYTVEKQQKNKKIDEYLLEERQNAQEKRQENFLEMLTKLNEKLIYEEHFGFPFYDLFKRIITTHGDLHPIQQTVKAMHSQVQILYAVLLGQDVLKGIGQRYSSYEEGLDKYLESIFPKEYELYYRFLKIYKNIKKSTEEEQSCDEDDEQVMQEIPLSQDETLQLDEKEFLVSLAETIPIDEFHQFIKNRSYNFLCFGLKKYHTFLSIDSSITSTLKKNFAEIMSFLTIRFIRKILFQIIRQRSNGILSPLLTPVTPQQVKSVGNQCIDSISSRIKTFLTPIKPIDEEGKQLFKKQFQVMSYRDFLPRRFISDATKKEIDPAEFAWDESKQYRRLWGQRVRAERYVRQGQKGTKPPVQYVDYILQHLQAFQKNSADLWKGYIMRKLGYEVEKKPILTKRVKLRSLND